jgi:uncharacterized protein
MKEFREKVLSLFKCQQSGHCCKCPGTVYVTAQDVEGMANILDENIIDFREKYVRKRNGWETVATPDFRQNCFLNKKNQCQVYDSRPNHCRTYPNWDELWVSKATIEAEAEMCPGLKLALKHI